MRRRTNSGDDRHVDAVNGGAPAGRRHETGQHADRGGLAGPVGTEQSEDFAAFHREVEPLHGGEIPEHLPEPLTVNRWRIGHGVRAGVTGIVTVIGNPALRRPLESGAK